MKRKIVVRSTHVRIVATLTTNGYPLTRDEVETLRDELADTLQSAAANVRWLGTYRHKVLVR